MHKGKMRHVEEVLDHAKARGPHPYPTTGHEAAVGLVGFRDIEISREACPALSRRNRSVRETRAATSADSANATLRTRLLRQDIELWPR